MEENCEGRNSEDRNSEDRSNEDRNSEDRSSEDRNSEDRNNENRNNEDRNSEDINDENENSEDINSEDGDSEDRHAHRRGVRFRIILMTVFICVGVAALVVQGIQAAQRRQAEEQLAQLAAFTQMYEDDTNNTEEPDAQDQDQENVGEEEEPVPDAMQRLIEMGIPIPEKEVDFTALQEEVNEDIYAWIYIPDSDIDYPVLQHPTDNTFYLEHNIDGSKGRPGCIYTEYYNSKDFTDPNTVIYGHNITSSTKPSTTMFRDLHKFEDSDYFEETPYIYIYTEEGLLVYEVFAAYVTGNEHILFSCDFGLSNQFSKYLENIFENQSTNANIREGVAVTSENRILTLSTCVYGNKKNRYLVQGVLLNGNQGSLTMYY